MFKNKNLRNYGCPSKVFFSAKFYDGLFVLQDGETALYQAADNGQEECVLTLLEAGCDPNILTVRWDPHLSNFS